MSDTGALILTPVELAFLGAAATPGGRVATVLLQQLGVPAAWVLDEAFQASGLQVLAARKLALVEPGRVTLMTSVAQVAAALSDTQRIVVLIAQGDDNGVSGVRIVDSTSGRVALTPTVPGCWRATAVDFDHPLERVAADAACVVLADQGGTVVVSVADGLDPTAEQTVVIPAGAAAEQVTAALAPLFAG